MNEQGKARERWIYRERLVIIEWYFITESIEMTIGDWKYI